MVGASYSDYIREGRLFQKDRNRGGALRSPSRGFYGEGEKRGGKKKSRLKKDGWDYFNLINNKKRSINRNIPKNAGGQSCIADWG